LGHILQAALRLQGRREETKYQEESPTGTYREEAVHTDQFGKELFGLLFG
jgi:hypothetical protein